MGFLYNLTPSVQQRWQVYQSERSLERFLTLRQAIATSLAYNPDSPDLTGVTESDLLLNQGSVSDGLATLKMLMPNWLLTPRIHLMASHLFEKAHQKNSADREVYLAEALRDSLLSTGTGSESYPYRILHVLDIQEVLRQLEKTAIGQRTVETNGKSLLACECLEGSTVYFEMPERVAQRALLIQTSGK
jgi:hypothetical protein